MKKSTIFLLAFFCLLFSCKKENHNQYSHWYIGNDSFASNNTNIEYGYGIYGPDEPVNVILRCLGSNGFEITFYNITVLPTNGSVLLADSADNINQTVFVGIYYTSGSVYKYYTASTFSSSYISASLVNGKAQYILPPTWFKNYFDSTDSALIHGVFNQP